MRRPLALTVALGALGALGACADKPRSPLWVYSLDRSASIALAEHCLPGARREAHGDASAPGRLEWVSDIRKDTDYPAAWSFLMLSFRWPGDRLSSIFVTISGRRSEFLAQDATRYRELLDCVFSYGRIPSRTATAALDAIDALGPDAPPRRERYSKAEREVREFEITAEKTMDEKTIALTVHLSIPSGIGIK